MDAVELKALLVEDRYFTEDPEGFKIVEEDEDVNGKYAFTYIVLKHLETNKYFRITEARSNVGHWGDSDLISQDVEAVEPVTKTIVQTTYKVIK
jgi:hypothetical protein